MSDEIVVTLPKLGESIVSATVLQWFKKEGDFVALDEPLLEVSTDKINSEIPSPVAGVVKTILAGPDQEIQVGAPLVVIEVGKGSSLSVTSMRSPSHTSPVSSPSTSEQEGFLSPAVLRLLQEHKIPLDAIANIPKTGAGGRLTKKDVEEYVTKIKACPHAKQIASRSTVSAAPHTERVKMSPVRKAIAENMVRSFYEAPHASLITEVDVTKLLKFIQENKETFLQQHGVKLTVTSLVAKAIARAVSDFPLINASLDGDTMLVKKFVNLGIVVSVDAPNSPGGVVMVPVIRDCQNLTLEEIAKQISVLATKARSGKLVSDDVKEGTITVTNFGMTGTMIGIPIIRFPEVAIVGLGSVTKKVVALPDDSIAVRSIMWISLTFDHRALDGLYGCGFLNALKAAIEL